MSHGLKNNDEVYRATGIADIIFSPVFFSVLFLAVILGLSSVYGFLQSPQKLKSAVNALNQKISITRKSNKRAINLGQYLMSDKANNGILNKGKIDHNRYSIFSESFDYSDFKPNHTERATAVSFEYDITSKQFWGDLDNSRIESAIEESIRDTINPSITGVPLELYPYLKKGDSKYSMKAALIKL